jgi:SAM-dependent methyltransferase
VEQKKEKIFRKYCPGCNKTEFKKYMSTRDYFLSQEEFELVRCVNCELVFTNPIPSLSELPSYYDSPDYLSHSVSKYSFTGFIYNQLREINLRGKYKLLSRFKKKGKILDIGQGTGEFLHFMQKKGWDVTGVEPNQSARKFASENYNLLVKEESVLQELEKNQFDLITMWHVLEHVVDLTERMQQVRSLLRKDGLLVIAVPNLNSPDSRKYKDKWAGLDVPRHLYHFTTKSMDNLLRSSGFRLVKLAPLKLDSFYVSLLSEKYLNNAFPYPKAFLSGLKSNSLASKENNYSSMVFVAKPD